MVNPSATVLSMLSAIALLASFALITASANNWKEFFPSAASFFTSCSVTFTPPRMIDNCLAISPINVGVAFIIELQFSPATLPETIALLSALIIDWVSLALAALAVKEDESDSI